VLVQHLSDGHTEVCSASDGESGFDLAKQCKPDLILLDVDMPGITGHEVCRRLKFDPQTQGIPIAFITANASVSDRIVGLDQGAVDYIVKPFDPYEVAARTRAAFRAKSQVAMAESYSMVDKLTGSGNRAAFEQHLRAELARAHRSAESLVCILMEPSDLDEVQRLEGDQIRDQVLSDVAAILKDASREEDRIFRYADRQFAVIAPNVNAADMTAVGERLSWAVETHPLLRHRTSLPIAMRIGLAISRFSLGRSVVEEAAEALLQAKNAEGHAVIPAAEMTALRLAY
jgi:diguanylate cyclase (GGDEF)-like protein